MREPVHDTQVTTDSGMGIGTVLGVILAIVLAGAVLWYLFGAGMTGESGTVPQSGTTTTDVRPPNTNVNPPAQP
jgi:hypothetical protein